MRPTEGKIEIPTFNGVAQMCFAGDLGPTAQDLDFNCTKSPYKKFEKTMQNFYRNS